MKKEKIIKLEHKGQIKLVAEFGRLIIQIEFEGQPTAYLDTSVDKAIDLVEGLLDVLELR